MPGDYPFGSWMKLRRRALDMTQLELAAKVGCAEITLQKIETGSRRPSRQMAERLAEELGIPGEQRPIFVKFARLGTAEPLHPGATQAAYRLAWSLTPTRAGNLPESPGSLIGRRELMEVLRRRIIDSEGRLFTLVGPPGVGKTRLAIHTAVQLTKVFSDGVFLVALEDVREADLVSTAIAQALRVEAIYGTSTHNRLREYLADKHLLLLLDNFEQVTAAASYVGDLLENCPWLSVLATSRTPLHLRRELLIPVPPLALPDQVIGEFVPDSSPAIDLFIARAQAVQPEFQQDPGNTVELAAMVSLLDGLPLAIELAAGLINLMPPRALLEMLTTRGMLQTEGFRDAPGRHQTLYRAIDWSYTLLSATEQAVFRRLAVFRSGCSLDAYLYIVNPVIPASDSPITALHSLVEHNLVIQQESYGPPRFRLLETVRSYARQRLAESGEEHDTLRLHASYFLILAETAEPLLRSGEQLAWLDILDLEGDNFRQALEWLIGRGCDPEAALHLANTLGWYWVMRGNVGEGCKWLTQALAEATQAPSHERAKAQIYLASLAWPGDLPAARRQIESSISLLREQAPGAYYELALALTFKGLVMAYDSDRKSLQEAIQESVELFNHLGDPWGTALALTVSGESSLLAQDYPTAKALFKAGYDLFKQTGDRWGMGIPLCNWGYTEWLEGNTEAGRRRIEEGVALHSQVGEKSSRAIYLNILAQIVQQQGDYPQAAALYAESLDLLRKMGLEANAADVLFNVANLTRSFGHRFLADQLLRECLALYTRQGNTEGIDRCQAMLDG